MQSSQTADLRELRDRVARGEYVVDPDAVAEAIVRRLLYGPGERPASNGDVEAIERPQARDGRSP